MNGHDPSAVLSIHDIQLMEQICDRFESAWRAGERPNADEYLDGVTGPLREILFCNLLTLETEYGGSKDRTGTAVPPGTRVADETAWLIPAAERDSSAEGDLPGSPSWRYQVLQEIGQGGIGRVHRGHDRELGRDIAIKTLRANYQENPEAHRRFLNEARIGSQLQHPAIVPVYDVGHFDELRPYLVMKLVEGRTLSELLKDRANPSVELPHYLSIFEQVCQALAYAHSRGIVHRDIKPANIMVGAFGEVQVMDWGFAKNVGVEPGSAGAGDQRSAEPRVNASCSPQCSAAPSLLNATQSGALMGTPAYMPPEQARGENSLIDQRTDVFALGAILCEIITGKPPYSGFRPDDCYRQATEGDLSDAYSRIDVCLADNALRTLAKQCLGAQREDRPTDARIVADKMTEYLASAQERLKTLQVERATAETRARAERRVRIMAMSLAAVFLLGSGLATWQAVVATGAKSDALQAATAETDAKTKAQAKEAETKAVFTFFRDRVLEAARPEGTAGGQGKDATIRTALDRAEPEIARTFSGQPAAEALVRYTLGQNYHYLGDQKNALRQNELALAIQRQHLPPDHPDTLATMNMLAISLKELGHLKEAATILDETLQAKRRVRGPEHRSTLLTMVNLAGVLVQLRRYDDAKRLYDEVLPIEQRVLGPKDNLTLDTMSGIAIMFINERKFEEARKLAEETFQLKEKYLGPEHISTMGTLCIFAGATDMLGRVEEAIPLYEEALQRQSRILTRDHRDTLRTMYHLGTALNTKKRFDEAAKLFRETADTQSRVLHPEHANTLRSMSGLAVALDGLGQLEEAHELFTRVLQIERRTLRENDPQTLDSMYNLANSLFKLGRWEESQKLHEESIALKKRVLGRDDPETIKSMDSLAWQLVIAPEAKYRDPSRATQLAKEVVQHSPKAGHYWTTLGAAHYRAGNWNDALIALEKAETVGPGSRTRHNAFFLAMSHWQQGRKVEARQWFDKGIERSVNYKSGNSRVMHLRNEAAELLGVQGQ